MSVENFNKAIEIYESLVDATSYSYYILELAMKYVPISTQSGIALHAKHDEWVKSLSKIPRK